MQYALMVGANWVCVMDPAAKATDPGAMSPYSIDAMKWQGRSRALSHAKEVADNNHGVKVVVYEYVTRAKVAEFTIYDFD